MAEKIIFKGFKQINGLAEGFSESSLESGFVYLVRTNADKTEGYIYFNGKKYGNIGTLDTKYDAAGAADTALASAKEYADGLAGNYDAKGAADTAEQNAKDYTDSLAVYYWDEDE